MCVCLCTVNICIYINWWWTIWLKDHIYGAKWGQYFYQFERQICKQKVETKSDLNITIAY